jgi:hypothetical protein
MIEIKTTSSASLWIRPQLVSAIDRAVPFLRAQAAGIFRLLVLLLVVLLFVLVGLVIVTGRGEIGGPILGSILFIGFSATQFGR